MKYVVTTLLLLIVAGFTYFLVDMGFNGETKILVVESYHQGYEWDKSYTQGLEEVLGQDYELSFFQMDTKRIPADEYEAKADEAFAEYKKYKPSLVVLGDDNALKFVGPKLLDTNTPVVFLGVNRNPSDYLGPRASEFTGVLERPLLKRSIYTLKRIIGNDLEKVLVMFDSGTTSRASLAHVFKGESSITMSEIKIDLKLIGSWNLWQKTVLDAKKNGYDAIIVGLYHTIFDQDNVHVDGDKVLKWTSNNTPVPPFGFWDFTVGFDKTIGGLVLYGKQQGIAAGEIAKRILAFDKKPEDIHPKIAERGRYLFSQAHLDKYNLTLPNDLRYESEFVD